jgi:hypothetical protein
MITLLYGKHTTGQMMRFEEKCLRLQENAVNDAMHFA